MTVDPITWSLGSESTTQPPTYDRAPEYLFLAQQTPEQEFPDFSASSIVHHSSPPTDPDTTDELFTPDKGDAMDSALHRIQGMIETTTRKCQAAEEEFNKPFTPSGLSIDILSDVSANVIVATVSPSNINHNIEIDPAKSIVRLDPV